jgi:Fic family protein
LKTPRSLGEVGRLKPQNLPLSQVWYKVEIGLNHIREFAMKYLETGLQQRIDQKLKRLQDLRPLPKAAVEKLKEKFQIEMTYNSNAIEGNSLTLKETFLVINEGITIKGKPLKDHLEAKDHHEALEFVYDLVQPQKRPTLSENLIRNIHSLVMQKTDEEWAGKYRNAAVFIGGADYQPPDASVVPAKMADLVNWFRKNERKLHPIELAALVHHKIVWIHPFFDGNGRTARLVMSILLMRRGYPLAVILKNDRPKYYRVLSQADEENFAPLVKFVAQAVERSLDIYLQTLTPASKRREEFLPLKEISKKTPYSAKYLNLLAREGKLEAHKKGRNWFSSVEAVERYVNGRKRQRG